MIFTETKLSGAYIIDLEPICDERGFFARTWCVEEFAAKGLHSTFVQCNISHSLNIGTLRGMHYQAEPYGEVKLVRCTKGAIYDVIVDLRKDSNTFCEWVAVELTSSNRRMLYIPKGFAHGFQTLVDDTEVFYQMSELYYPQYARGIRWNDSSFKIKWKIDNKIISNKDNNWPLFEDVKTIR